jgi:hypothetical protein
MIVRISGHGKAKDGPREQTNFTRKPWCLLVSFSGSLCTIANDPLTHTNRHEFDGGNQPIYCR